MVDFTINKISQLMKQKTNIRNLSIIAHVDHGKSTLTDSLVAAAGIISVEQAGNQRIMDTRDDEQERCITIKSTGISLYYDIKNENIINETQENTKEFLINLIDSPGHVDFSSEVTAALRITDGALVVVDCIEEVCVQTETVLRQALSERILPALVINKLDRCFIELNYDGERAYESFSRVVENINIIIATYHDEAIGELYLHPTKNNTTFSAGIHGWSFTIKNIAIYIGKRMKINPDKLREKLWGNNFYDNNKKKWTKKKTPNCIRGFVRFIYDPIKLLISKCVEEQYSELEALCVKLGISMIFKNYYPDSRGKLLMKKIMQAWLPAHKSILEMIIDHLPSPGKSQKYRTEIMYEGPIDDIYSKSMQNCDPSGPLMLYISKMIPNIDKSRFLAFGRIFSGTVKSGMKIRIMGNSFIKGSVKDLFLTTVHRVILCMGRKFEPIEEIPCGNTVALAGLDQFILKNATITNSDNENAYPIKAMKFSVHPVVRRAITVLDPNNLPKLIDGMKKLSKSDPLVQCIEDNGEYVIAGAGELHLEICIKDLKDDFLNGIELIISDPIVPYRESIIKNSDHICLSKSSNKHNRIFAKALPLNQKIARNIEDGLFESSSSKTELVELLNKTINNSKIEVRNIWSFGPEISGSNILIDGTKSVQYLEEIKDSCISAFHFGTKEGVLMKENMRGIILKIEDVVLHSDAIHRGGGQIIPAFRKVIYAAFLSATPRLSEPIFLVDITTPKNSVSGVYSVIANKRGKVFEEITKQGSPVCVIKAYLPVAESFGFATTLREATSGQAFPQCVFDHWDILGTDPFKDQSYSNKILLENRKRKGLNLNLPKIEDYEDKL
ncbi:elongation factor EF-2 (nucleomorph) [Lotharella oceanica]|uniref:Elongation factor EF-2 n=1 Tax=Lotharella oceanica TaxID=641309 RepID=A0A060DG62_9EUKA|nr:elongation factor EF-2 [Lotharella oceanica]|mmetsp:Transcript_4863/g.9671  ORF Transcript_4863/g.9671 Transcript_4863/m.9671 type:complete len:842 (-) Transcript_4863:389-2914(-)